MFCAGGMYNILPELKLRAIFLAGCFVNTYPQEERVQVLISQRELSKVTGDSPNIFKKSNIDRYMERQFILWNFCYVYFLAYYTLENKWIKTDENTPDEMDESLIQKNHKEYFYKPNIKLMISRETLRCSKVKQIFWYHVQINICLQKNLLIICCFWFCTFRDQKQVLSGRPPLY